MSRFGFRRTGFLVRVALLGALAAVTAGACAKGDDVKSSTTGGGGGGGAITGTGGGETGAGCISHNCHADAECAACPNGNTTCDQATHFCVSCGPGKACPAGLTCSSFGSCVPAGATCPTDSQGTPTVVCGSSADCAACDPLHQVCDLAASACVACTDVDSSACLSTERCVSDRCVPRCPAACATDNDCSQCGGPGHAAHACNAHQCAQCSKTYACPSGTICSTEGVCVAKCGQDGAGSCSSDDDCMQCMGGSTQCHHPLNGPGQCGPVAAGCSDLGQGAVVLPDPWNQVTNLCSHDADCAGVGVQLDVGKLLRDLTGISQIGDANIDYGMNVCAAITVGVGGNDVSCGLCVPCRVDADCHDIDVDQIAGEAFGPIGSVAAAILLDQVFGPNDHRVHMYCQDVAGGYGVCAPCPGILYACGMDHGTNPGTCAHDTCAAGDALDVGCDACTMALCAADGYCCSTAWDSQCVGEVATYCTNGC